MLGKLLKYDLRAVFKGWIIAMITMVISTVSSAISLKIKFAIESKPYSAELWFLQAMLTLIASVGIIVSGICLFSVFVMLLVRFYKHLFTDEGYLTFTLPVSRKQIFLSKMLNAIIWIVLSYIIIFLCVNIFYAIVLVESDDIPTNLMSYTLICVPLLVMAYLERVNLLLIQFIIIANSILATVVGYFCITLGATVVKRGKLLISIGAYYLLNAVYTLAVQFMGTVSLTALLMCFVERLPGQHESNVWFAAVLITVLFALITLSAFFYCLTQNIIERKLNLA